MGKSRILDLFALASLLGAPLDPIKVKRWILTAEEDH
jgi:hypothetical protein